MFMPTIKTLKYAKECLSCINKPCSEGCPLNNEIPDFIDEIKNNNYQKAFEVLSQTTVLMPICGRICPQAKQCEGSCVRGINKRPVKIGHLEAMVGDIALNNNWTIKVPKRTKHKVAIVGGGPAGLTCAVFLRRNGIGVTIYEKKDYLGGLLMHGIPSFRLSKKIVNETTQKIIDLGIDVKYNMCLGENLTIDELKKEYDAIFLGIGANVSNRLDVPGENLENVYGGNELLEYKIKLNYQNKTVAIIGGGNVSIDVARTIKRKGAKKVIVIYRKQEGEMSADTKEVEAAKNEAIEFLPLTSVVKINGIQKVRSIELIKNKIIKNKDGKITIKPIKNSNYNIKCDYFIKAIGSHAEEFVKELPLVQNNGKILIDENGKTSDKKIFSGGDVAGTKQTVAWAARAGRIAADSIIEFLNN